MSAFATQWAQEGYVVVRGLFDPDLTARLRDLCYDVLKQWRVCNPETGKSGGGPESTVMRHLNHPGYFRDHPDRLHTLLTTIARQDVRGIVRDIFGEEEMFRCTSLFFNPQENSREGHWHRDTQFRAADDAAEKEMILSRRTMGGGVQLQVALVPSDDVEVVPGSHLRWDSPEEYHIRKADGGQNNRSNDMPGAMRVALEPGDAVAFNPAGLHRGRYYTDRERHTLMLTYSRSRAPYSDYFSHQPWFLEPGYLSGLSDDARAFFEAFVAQYQSDWQSA